MDWRQLSLFAGSRLCLPPLLLLAPMLMKTIKRELLDNGCNDFVAKPLSKEVLLMTIHKYL